MNDELTAVERWRYFIYLVISPAFSAYKYPTAVLVIVHLSMATPSGIQGIEDSGDQSSVDYAAGRQAFAAVSSGRDMNQDAWMACVIYLCCDVRCI